jgi:CheY-like chemotaxis protein
MSEKPKVIIIEDKDEDLREVSNYIADIEFCNGEDILGTAGTYSDALGLLEEKSEETDVVFLDLNLPRDAQDARPEKGHGRRLLDHIHNLNKRASVSIKVIVVSAETLDEVWDKEPLKKEYGATLVGFVHKAELPRMLKSNLRRLRRDLLRDRIRRGEIEVLNQYDSIVNPECPIRERLAEARSLAIRLVQYELDYFSRSLGSSDWLTDDLNGAIKDLESRFNEDPKSGRRYVSASAIRTPGGWGAFLWRGTLIQHLYALNNYRNDHVHVNQKPFRGDGQSQDEWVIPPIVLVSAERGEILGQIVELIVCELLEWFIPWHEQVYLPWVQSLADAGGGRR